MRRILSSRTFFVAFVFLASLALLGGTPHNAMLAHGALVGTVCIAPQGVSKCPSSPVIIPGPASGSLTISVFINSSDSFGGISVSVVTDPTILNPTSISDTGTAVPGSLLTLIDCVNGAPQAGAGCNPYDGVGIASLGISSLGTLTVPPTTGLLFTITYNILAITTGTPISFLTDSANCAGQSVANTNDCLLITAGAATIPENAQTATFVNSATFFLSASPTSAQIKVGQSGTSTITATGYVGYTGVVTLAPTINSTATSHPVPTAAPPTIALTSTTTSGMSTLTVPTLTSSQAGGYNVTVTGSDGSQSRTVSFILKVVAVPTLATTLSSNPIVVGSTVHDSATLSGASTNAGGTVTYNLFTTSSCAGTPKLISSVTVTAGVVPSSGNIPINSTGTFSFNATYSGDFYDQSASACEPLTVNRASPSLSTTLSSNTITVGTTASDTATITSGFFGPASGTPFSSITGNVTYNLFTSNACTGPSNIISFVNVNGNTGSVPASRLVIFNSTGTFGWNATYTGDSNNNRAQGGCELLTVQPASPTVTTNLSANSVGVGGSASDTATLAGGYNPTGTVTYHLFVDGTGACTGTSHIVSTVTVSGNGAQPSSRAVTFNSTVTTVFGWNATYSGDSNNNKEASICELLTVTANPDFSISSSISSLTLTVGTTSSTTATITITSINNFAGSIKLTNSTSPFVGVGLVCSPNPVSVTTTTPGTSTCTFTGRSAGTFMVTITGTSVSPAVAESITPAITVTVTMATSALASTLSTGTITLSFGSQTATDTATLTGSYFATGTIVFQVFGPGDTACTGASQTLSTLTVNSNGAYTSSAFTPARGAGTYEFVASYSGDGNNTRFVTPCGANLEILTVNRAAPTISTQLFNATDNTALSLTGGAAIAPVHGTAKASIYDSASISGAFSVTGLVTYREYNGFACTGSPTIVHAVTIVNGNVPTLTTPVLSDFPAGNYSFTAIYGGDGNNTLATGSCEPLTVNALPIAVFQVTPQSSYYTIDTALSFNATLSVDPDASVLSDKIVVYTWNFGDGTAPISLASPGFETHSYAKVGTYTVTLTVTDSFDGMNSTGRTINVVQPVITIGTPRLSPSSPTIGDKVTLIVDIRNTGSVTLSFTVAMDVGSQTVDQTLVTLTPGQDNSTITLHWDTASYSETTYTITVKIVNPRINGSNGQPVSLPTSSQSAGNLALASQPTSPLQGSTLWIIVGAVAAAAVAATSFLVIRRRKTPAATA